MVNKKNKSNKSNESNELPRSKFKPEKPIIKWHDQPHNITQITNLNIIAYGYRVKPLTIMKFLENNLNTFIRNHKEYGWVILGHYTSKSLHDKLRRAFLQKYCKCESCNSIGGLLYNESDVICIHCSYTTSPDIKQDSVWKTILV